MANLVKIKVDGQTVEVEKGKNLIDALATVGINIPHFCYHPALGFDGNCRLCLVEIEGARGPQIACNTVVQEDMEVYLERESSKNLRRRTLEFTLINHPLDCPICDQAGECKLQDYYMELGPYESRMDYDKKVPKGKKFDFGCNVVHDQERCVLCARCVRFLRQYTKTAELGITNRGELARVTTFPDKPINNRYAMNIVDICPVGAMTSSDFRFRQRVWFMQTANSVCHGCSKGCSIFVDHNQEKYKEDKVYRFRPRPNDKINGHFMCDAGRLSYQRENENRLKSAKIAGSPESTASVVAAAARTLAAADGSVFFVVSPSWTTEQMYSAKKLAAHYHGKISGYSTGTVVEGDADGILIQDDKAANRASLELLGISQDKAHFTRYLRESEVIVLLGSDILAGRSDEQVQELRQELEGKKVLLVDSHLTESSRIADMLLPCASFTEYAGTLINCDGILQQIDAAVCNENGPVAAEVLMGELSGNAWNSDLAAIREELSGKVAALADAPWSSFPASGVALDKKEAHA